MIMDDDVPVWMDGLNTKKDELHKAIGAIDEKNNLMLEKLTHLTSEMSKLQQNVADLKISVDKAVTTIRLARGMSATLIEVDYEVNQMGD
jgi:predicted  nucleic acid-binding Zn-ribbon protein